MKPITDLLKGKDNENFRWTEVHNKAIKEIQELINKRPVLQHPDFNEDFRLEMDASEYGLGGILAQSKGPVAYFSKSLVRNRNGTVR